VARVSRSALGDADATTLVQRGTRLFVGLGDFFANQGARAGLALVDVQSPESPSVRSRWLSPTVLSGSTAMLLDGNHLFLGAKRHGVFIFDVSRSDTLVRIAEFLPDPNFPKNNPGSTEYPNTRGLALSGNRLYVANDAGGLRIVDVTNRAAPVEVAKYLNTGALPKPQAYNSVVLAGSVAYLAVDYCGLEIVDIANPAALRQLGWWNPWGCETSANFWFNSPGHTNQLALDQSRGLAYLSAGASELVVIDVSDPSRPVLRGQFEASGGDQGAWGLALAPDETYVTYILAAVPFRGTWAGVRAISPIR
jgi:hypothetical protein